MQKVIAIGIGVITLGVAAYLLRSNDPEKKSFATAVRTYPEAPPNPTTTAANGWPTSSELAPTSNSLGRKEAKPIAQVELPSTPRELEFLSLVNSLRLETQASEKLLNILADEQKRARAWLAANRRNFISAEEANGLQTESNQLARELLGDAKFAQYTDYRKHSSERKPIDRVNEELIRNASPPLPQELDDWLFTTLKEETTRSATPALSAYETHLEYEAALRQWHADNMKRFLDRAASVLTPDVFAILQRASL